MLTKIRIKKLIYFNIILFIIFIFTISHLTYKYDDIKYTKINNVSANKKLFFGSCKLNKPDPWDPSILRFINPLFDPMENCKPSIKQYSKLQNGQLFIYINQTNEKCLSRCLHPKDDYNYLADEWRKIENGTKPNCDVVEVECHKIDDNEIGGYSNSSSFYNFLHAQIFRSSKKPEMPQITLKPDVHIIVMDSVSTSQFVRNMLKTKHYLKKNYEAIPFNHLNKAGVNSRPNGFAFLMGKMINYIVPSLATHGHFSDYVNGSYCHEYLDNDQFIGFRFEDDGYVTMMSEDWALGVFNWQGCKGFKTQPTDHYMRPFQLRIDEKNDAESIKLQEAVYKNPCVENHETHINYLQSFLDAYPDKPKFSLTWISYLTHGENNALFHTDEFFYRFFKKNQAQFNNSYLFLMGDHGNRYGRIHETEAGEREDKNPLLFLSVPANLRKNSMLMHTIRENTKKLTSHYDVYATLASIVNPPNPRISSPLIKGISLFEPISSNRTCDDLQIPLNHCSCEFEKIKHSPSHELAVPAANFIINKMNNDLSQSKLTKNKCAKLRLLSNASITLDEFVEKSEDVTIYKIKFQTKPGNGKFNAMIVQNSINGSLTILNNQVTRINGYGSQSKCAIMSFYAPYCYCKNLLKVKS